MIIIINYFGDILPTLAQSPGSATASKPALKISSFWIFSNDVNCVSLPIIITFEVFFFQIWSGLLGLQKKGGVF